MLGSTYSDNIHILFDSFAKMNKTYSRHIKSYSSIALLPILQKMYIRVFGIPEIGLQVRIMYFQQALKKLSHKKFTNILDAGSGIGIYTLYLARLYPESRITGWDIDTKKVTFCKKIVKQLKIRNASFVTQNIIDILGHKNTYDLIVTVDVLEHIENYKQFLKNMHTLLNKGGFLYIHTPQLKQKRFFASFKRWRHSDHQHQGFSSITLQKELRRLGFEIIFKKNTFGFFGSLAWELNHLTLMKSFVLAGCVFPLLYIFSALDLLIKNKRGLGIAIVAKK